MPRQLGLFAGGPARPAESVADPLPTPAASSPQPQRPPRRPRRALPGTAIWIRLYLAAAQASWDRAAVAGLSAELAATAAALSGSESPAAWLRAAGDQTVRAAAAGQVPAAVAEALPVLVLRARTVVTDGWTRPRGLELHAAVSRMADAVRRAGREESERERTANNTVDGGRPR